MTGKVAEMQAGPQLQGFPKWVCLLGEPLAGGFSWKAKRKTTSFTLPFFETPQITCKPPDIARGRLFLRMSIQLTESVEALGEK